MSGYIHDYRALLSVLELERWWIRFACEAGASRIEIDGVGYQVRIVLKHEYRVDEQGGE